MDSVKESVRAELEALYDIKAEDGEFLPEELAKRLAFLTEKINREIAVYMNRRGQVVDISVGDSSTVSLPQIEGRRGFFRLSGIRCIHTHPNGTGLLSAVDLNSLINLKLDAIAAIGVDNGQITDIYAALPLPEGEGTVPEIYGPFYYCHGEIDELTRLVSERDKQTKNLFENAQDREKAILVGLETNKGRNIGGKSEGQRLLDELEELAVTAGVTVLDKVLQRKNREDPAFFLGKGKIMEINLLRQAIGADLLIFDDELSGAQIRNIEEATGVKVIDRTTLILDIFAQRARSLEGKLQVELAQLKYRLPRLTGMGNQLSRLGGGIGTRGPGEKKLETDRRHIRKRISTLENELSELLKRRSLMRESRKKNDLPVIALVGYTNAGKSTLMNALCGSDVFAEDKLFATLDPTIRKLQLSDNKKALLVDTVGFIRKLPHDLVEAFKSTLEETISADILLHVVDSSSEEADIQISVVNEILNNLGALNKPVIMVLNKTDLITEEFRISYRSNGYKSYEVSAITGNGIQELLSGIADMIVPQEIMLEILAPYDEGWVMTYIYDSGKVIESEYLNEGIRVKTLIRAEKADRIRKYIAVK
ncbi:MAG: GTPase HflX [Bacillota bacterium]|nr:GTPase HflX [Bacillota bacterium]